MSIEKYQFFKLLQTLPFVKRIILYGSRARGNHQERSDIDIAIDCPDATENEWLLVSDIIEQADTLLKIDCIRFDQLKDNNPLKIAIQKEGKTIYERPDKTRVQKARKSSEKA